MTEWELHREERYKQWCKRHNANYEPTEKMAKEIKEKEAIEKSQRESQQTVVNRAKHIADFKRDFDKASSELAKARRYKSQEHLDNASMYMARLESCPIDPTYQEVNGRRCRDLRNLYSEIENLI